METHILENSDGNFGWCVVGEELCTVSNTDTPISPLFFFLRCRPLSCERIVILLCARRLYVNLCKGLPS